MKGRPDFGAMAIGGATAIVWAMLIMFGDLFVLAVPHVG
jgi:hypothetical protein